jgi:hypothetical protein
MANGGKRGKIKEAKSNRLNYNIPRRLKMAKLIHAVTKYRPRIKRRKPASFEEVSALIGRQTFMSPGAIINILLELSFALAHFLNLGRSVKLPGVGLFSCIMTLNGDFKIKFRADNALSKELNQGINPFSGEIINKINIGKSNHQLIRLWNKEHPDDLIHE